MVAQRFLATEPLRTEPLGTSEVSIVVRIETSGELGAITTLERRIITVTTSSEATIDILDTSDMRSTYASASPTCCWSVSAGKSRGYRESLIA